MVHHDDADGLCSAMHACLTEASKGFGIADGHEYAANVVAPVDKKEDLIRNAEEILCA